MAAARDTPDRDLQARHRRDVARDRRARRRDGQLRRRSRPGAGRHAGAAAAARRATCRPTRRRRCAAPPTRWRCGCAITTTRCTRSACPSGDAGARDLRSASSRRGSRRWARGAWPASPPISPRCSTSNIAARATSGSTERNDSDAGRGGAPAGPRGADRRAAAARGAARRRSVAAVARRQDRRAISPSSTAHDRRPGRLCHGDAPADPGSRPRSRRDRAESRDATMPRARARKPTRARARARAARARPPARRARSKAASPEQRRGRRPSRTAPRRSTAR